ncbi:hypothetical protein EAI_15984 [Harpegnathos saltator]|uniref:Uncharacterized protein n=1 Tax=Harpegnathos saltator TaxID=610380 RepID=E2BG34_HARSA|nr:hypothetical protein EAI_15984 [Harpegnathos saltator]
MTIACWIGFAIESNDARLQHDYTHVRNTRDGNIRPPGVQSRGKTSASLLENVFHIVPLLLKRDWVTYTWPRGYLCARHIQPAGVLHSPGTPRSSQLYPPTTHRMLVTTDAPNARSLTTTLLEIVHHTHRDYLGSSRDYGTNGVTQKNVGYS